MVRSQLIIRKDEDLYPAEFRTNTLVEEGQRYDMEPYITPIEGAGSLGELTFLDTILLRNRIFYGFPLFGLDQSKLAKGMEDIIKSAEGYANLQYRPFYLVETKIFEGDRESADKRGEPTKVNVNKDLNFKFNDPIPEELPLPAQKPANFSEFLKVEGDMDFSQSPKYLEGRLENPYGFERVEVEAPDLRKLEYLEGKIENLEVEVETTVYFYGN